jgi:hypothetical protein
MPNSILTIPQYVKHIKGIKKISRQGVLKSVQKNKLHLLPGVVKTTKIGRDHLLEVST